MSAPLRQRLFGGRGVQIAIALYSIALIAVLCSMLLVEQYSEREEAIATAVTQNANLAVAYEEHIVSTLKGLDNVLLFMRREYWRLGTQMDIQGYIEEGIVGGDSFLTLSVIDERGNVVLKNMPIVPANYADREHFRVHQQQSGQDSLHIGVPVLGRTSKSWHVPISRRISKPDGSFGGIITLSVDPGFFTGFYQKVNLGEHGMIALVGLDGIYRARRAGKTVTFGDKTGGGSQLREQVKNQVGDFVSRDDADGIVRMVSYRTLPGYPLMVAVGAAEDEVMEEFISNRNRDYVLALLAAIAIAAFAWMLMVTVSRQQRASAALIASEARFRAAFEQAAIGIVHTSLDRRYLQVNQKFCDMLGYTSEELIGRKASNFHHPDDPAGEGAYIKQLLSGDVDSVTAERRYIRKDGGVIWVNRTISLVRDHAGRPLHFLRVIEDITERKRLEAELRELAVTDVLTGLPNRRAFMTRLEEEHARIRRFDAQQAAVLMLDLDHFKRINDSYGHPAGDALLRQVGAVIRDETRQVDMCSRLGGEEFAILLAGATPEAGQEFAERLRRRIAETCVMYEGKSITVTASIGVAALLAADSDADAALVRADRALYQAKDVGRDQVRVMTA
jgi:diguanylate cyclase (GGDEF)-like protein/PAS domain S-box-containing protein